MGFVYSDPAAVASHASPRTDARRGPVGPSSSRPASPLLLDADGSGRVPRRSTPPSPPSAVPRFLLRYSSLLSDSGCVPLVTRLDELDFLAAGAGRPSLLARRDRTLDGLVVPAVGAARVRSRSPSRPRLAVRPDDRRAPAPSPRPLPRLRSLPPDGVVPAADAFFSPPSAVLVPPDLPADLPRRPDEAVRDVAAGVTDLLLLPTTPTPPSPALGLPRDMDRDLSTVSVLGTPAELRSTSAVVPRRPADRLRGGS